VAKRLDAVKEMQAEIREEMEGGGWSVQEMAQTVGRMIRGADKLARTLADATESMQATYSMDTPATARDVSDLARALQSVATALTNYSEVYAWCTANGKTGKEDNNVLERVLSTCTAAEARFLDGLIARAEAEVRV